MNDEYQVIYAYTRSQAIADGVLVDVSDTAREAGYRVPVALTATVWERCVSVPRGAEGSQDARGRLWDVLWMCRVGMQGKNLDSSEIKFGLGVFTGERTELVTLKAVIGPDDDGGPCLTIMLPEED